MFQITLCFSGVELRGLKAVEFCRAHNLEERSRIYSGASAQFLVANVGETFARLWFERDDITDEQESVTIDMLMPGELVFSGQRLMLAELPDPRIMDLYIAAKFRRVRDGK